jgi:hypothetical protein
LPIPQARNKAQTTHRALRARKEKPTPGGVAVHVKRVDAVVWAALHSTQEGFWFDDRSRFIPCAESRHFVQLRDRLYAPIFLANGGRDRDRRRRMLALEAFLANLAVSASFLGYRRRAAVLFHRNRNRWTRSSLSHDHLIKIFRYFKVNRYICTKWGYFDPKAGKGKVTRMMPQQKLIFELCDCITRNEAEFYIASRPECPVVLKDAEGQPVPFRETRQVKELIGRINAVNEVNSSFAVTYRRSDNGMRYPVNTYVFAVFNNSSWATAGRFYGSRHSHVNMARKERRTILIHGDRISELDFASLHVNLLYAKVGRVFKGDPYSCVLGGAGEGVRDLLKEVLLSLLNDKCSEAALIAHVEFRLLRRDLGINKFRHPLAWEDAVTECRRNRRLLDKHGLTAAGIVRGFKRAHRPIADFFHAGTWAEMQNVDSTIALEVMTSLTGRGVPCLPRHDSFVTQHRHVGLLEEAMHRAYGAITKRLYGREFPICIKTEIHCGRVAA